MQYPSPSHPRHVPTSAPVGNGLGSFYAGAISNNSSFTTRVSNEKPPKVKELSDRRQEYGVVWITHIRFARRALGLRTFRAVFAKAGRDRWTPWEVYEAAGMSDAARYNEFIVINNKGSGTHLFQYLSRSS